MRGRTVRPRFQMSLDGSPVVVVVELLGQCLVGTLTGKRREEESSQIITMTAATETGKLTAD